MEYLAFYGLETEPFSNAPLSRFYFESRPHNEALVRLQFALSAMKGLALCIGETGAGKTTLARRLLESLDEVEYEAALLVILRRDISAEWLLRRLAFQLGVPSPSNDKLVLLSQLYQRLLEIQEAKKKAVVLIDEAQMLESKAILEEFRGLLNLEVPGQKLLSFVFFGPSELETNLRLDTPLHQRVAVRVSLGAFDLFSTAAYMIHRLKIAGATYPVFNRPALEVIHHASGGIPRLINTLSDNCLLEGALSGHRQIDGDRANAVADNLGLPVANGASRPAFANGNHLSQHPSEAELALEEIDDLLHRATKPA